MNLVPRFLSRRGGHRSLLSAAVLLLTLAALPGCETTDAGGAQPAASGTAIPLSVLDTIYAARTAMTALADGSAQDPTAAAQTVAQAYAVFQDFGARITQLDRSFNSNDYTELWQQLAQMGSYYQINTTGFSALQLRTLEGELRGFRGDVADLERLFTTYLETYTQFVAAMGGEVSMSAVQQRIPLVNQLTTLSVDLDQELRDFSDALTQLSAFLQRAQYGV